MTKHYQFETFSILLLLNAAYQPTIGIYLECKWASFVCYTERHITNFSNITQLTVEIVEFAQPNSTKLKIVDDFRTSFSNVKDVKILNITERTISSNNFRLFQHMENINMSSGSIYVLTKVFLDGNSFKSIDLSFNKIRFVGDRTFSSCKLLKTIYLNNNVLTQIQDKTFAGIPIIEEIFLNSNLIDTIQPNAFDIPNLERLHLQNNQLVELADGLFTNAPKYLDLSSNQLKHVGGAFNDAIKLTNLIMNNNPQLHNVNLNALSELYSLNEISLNGTGFYFQERLPSHVYYGTTKRRHSIVKHLNLHNNFIVYDKHDDDISTLLKALSTVFPFLKSLHTNLVTDIQHLAYYFPAIKNDTVNNYENVGSDFPTMHYNSSKLSNYTSNYTIN